MNEKPCLCGTPGCMAIQRPRESDRNFFERRKYASPACAGSSAPMTAKEIALVVALQAEGLSFRRIAARLGRKRTAIQRAMYRHRNPVAKPDPIERPSPDEDASNRLLRALRHHPLPVEMTGVMRGVPVRLLSDRGAWA
jgi:hypothetical protein